MIFRLLALWTSKDILPASITCDTTCEAMRHHRLLRLSKVGAVTIEAWSSSLSLPYDAAAACQAGSNAPSVRCRSLVNGLHAQGSILQHHRLVSGNIVSEYLEFNRLHCRTILDFLADCSSRVRYTTSVCTGALPLGAAATVSRRNSSAG